MPTEEGDTAITKSVKTEGRDDVMDSDASVDANAATTSSEPSSPRGTSTSAIETGDLQSDNIDADYENGSATEEEEGKPLSQDGGNVAESSHATKGEDTEELVIVPNLGGDPIILPSKSKPRKTTEAVDGDDGSNHDQSMQIDGAPDEGQPTDDSTQADDNISDEESSAKMSESSNSECTSSVEESAASSKEVPTNEPPLCDEADINTDAASTEDNIKVEATETEASSDDSNKSSQGEQIESSQSSDVENRSGSTESSNDDKDRADETPDAENDDNAQSKEPSTDSESSKQQDIDAKANSNKTSTDTSETKKGAESEDDGPRQIKLVDYASKLAGAQILEQSSSLKGASNLLTGDRDKYSIAPCEDKKYVVIGLSEDILVKQIKLGNYERYSSRVKEFQVLASQEYPIPNEEYWNSIGTYTAKSKSGEQTFELKEPAWARYLKLNNNDNIQLLYESLSLLGFLLLAAYSLSSIVRSTTSAAGLLSSSSVRSTTSAAGLRSSTTSSCTPGLKRTSRANINDFLLPVTACLILPLNPEPSSESKTNPPWGMIIPPMSSPRKKTHDLVFRAIGIKLTKCRSLTFVPEHPREHISMPLMDSQQVQCSKIGEPVDELIEHGEEGIVSW